MTVQRTDRSLVNCTPPVQPESPLTPYEVLLEQVDSGWYHLVTPRSFPTDPERQQAVMLDWDKRQDAADARLIEDCLVAFGIKGHISEDAAKVVAANLRFTRGGAQRQIVSVLDAWGRALPYL